MRIPFDHPLHDFEEIEGMPSIPSATGKTLKTYRCRTCGISGDLNVSGTWLHLHESAQRCQSRASVCLSRPMVFQGKTVLIIADNLPERGPQYAGLSRNTPAKPALREDAGTADGIWITGPNGDAKLVPGDYSIIRVRARTRTRHA